ncbi:MAG TPA: hypothetical protein VFS39_05645 [Nitrospira sp.]|nr:hypothetical protein [Nitrospira sp.]
MQMVMMVFRSTLEEEVLPLVEEEDLPFTRLDGVQGKGETGNVPGSVTWGGSNTVLLLAVPDDRFQGFRKRVQQFQQQMQARPKSVGVPFHIFVLPCIQLL